MNKHLAAEEIYDAMLDDDAFARLPGRMAEAYGARSCVLHWRQSEGSADIMGHNGYYPDEQMLNYAENFAGVDDWSLEGLRPERVNLVWNCDELVAPASYENSIFYNEWIRGMGDDTFHCLGTAVSTRRGFGFVGLHRGRGQGTFSEENARSLRRDIVHLRRMLAIKGSVSVGLQRADRAEAVLDSSGQLFITVTSDGQVVHANSSAQALLRRADGLDTSRGKLFAHDLSSNRALASAIAAASSPSECSASAISVMRPGGGRYDLTISTLRKQGGPALVLITARDPDLVDPSLEKRLTVLYDLTSAEASITVRLADGARLTEIAGERGVSVETIRSQLKSVFDKLGCDRQGEVVAIVKSLPPLQA